MRTTGIATKELPGMPWKLRCSNAPTTPVCRCILGILDTVDTSLALIITSEEQTVHNSLGLRSGWQAHREEG